MYKIENLTNSPFDLQSVNGRVLLPAFGFVEGVFDGSLIAALSRSLSVKVTEVFSLSQQDAPRTSKRAKAQ